MMIVCLVMYVVLVDVRNSIVFVMFFGLFICVSGMLCVICVVIDVLLRLLVVGVWIIFGLMLLIVMWWCVSFSVVVWMKLFMLVFDVV